MPKPRLIVFVVGGVTYSEIRAAYEVAEQYPSHDVFIGTLDQLFFICLCTTCVKHVFQVFAWYIHVCIRTKNDRQLKALHDVAIVIINYNRCAIIIEDDHCDICPAPRLHPHHQSGRFHWSTQPAGYAI